MLRHAASAAFAMPHAHIASLLCCRLPDLSFYLHVYAMPIDISMPRLREEQHTYALMSVCLRRCRRFFRRLSPLRRRHCRWLAPSIFHALLSPYDISLSRAIQLFYDIEYIYACRRLRHIVFTLVLLHATLLYFDMKRAMPLTLPMPDAAAAL